MMFNCPVIKVDWLAAGVLYLSFSPELALYSQTLPGNGKEGLLADTASKLWYWYIMKYWYVI